MIVSYLSVRKNLYGLERVRITNLNYTRNLNREKLRKNLLNIDFFFMVGAIDFLLELGGGPYKAEFLPGMWFFLLLWDPRTWSINGSTNSAVNPSKACTGAVTSVATFDSTDRRSLGSIPYWLLMLVDFGPLRSPRTNILTRCSVQAMMITQTEWVTFIFDRFRSPKRVRTRFYIRKIFFQF